MFLVILNLPPDVRMNAQNVVLVGLWYGSKKPPMHLLLKQVMQKLDQLYTLGVAIETAHGLVTYRAKLELAIFDLPAKASVLCSKHFNWKYGCSVSLPGGIFREMSYVPSNRTPRAKS